MCGIVGVFGKQTRASINMFQMMLLLDQKRGTDATGVVTVEHNGDVGTYKEALTAHKFFETPTFDDINFNRGQRLLLGHNRAATTGNKASKTNAHPFHHGIITGVHNGTLRNRVLEGKNSFGTDSEGVFWSLNQDEGEPQGTWGRLYGAATLVWWNAATEKLNMIRNVERPMYFCPSSDGKQLYFASEIWMIKRAAELAGISHETPMEPQPNYHFEFDIIKGQITEVAKELVPFSPPLLKDWSQNEKTDAKPRNGNVTIMVPSDTTTKVSGGFWRRVRAKDSAFFWHQRQPKCLTCGKATFSDELIVEIGDDLGMCDGCATRHIGTNLLTLVPLRLKIKEAS